MVRDPYARWCDRESPQGPTYVNQVQLSRATGPTRGPPGGQEPSTQELEHRAGSRREGVVKQGSLASLLNSENDVTRSVGSRGQGTAAAGVLQGRAPRHLDRVDEESARGRAGIPGTSTSRSPSATTNTRRSASRSLLPVCSAAVPTAQEEPQEPADLRREKLLYGPQWQSSPQPETHRRELQPASRERGSQGGSNQNEARPGQSSDANDCSRHRQHDRRVGTEETDHERCVR